MLAFSFEYDLAFPIFFLCRKLLPGWHNCSCITVSVGLLVCCECSKVQRHGSSLDDNEVFDDINVEQQLKQDRVS